MGAALTIDDLVLRAEIEDVVMRYATALDKRDWDLFRTVFADDADITYPGLGHFTSGASFTEFMRTVHQPAGPSTHRMSNVVVGGTTPLSARTYANAYLQHKNDPAKFDHSVGYYDDTFVRTEGGLRIASRSTTMVVYEQPTTNQAPGFDL